MKGTILLLTALLLFGCAEDPTPDTTGKPMVFVSIPPMAGLLKEIAGNDLEIRTLLGEGQSPHAYEPTARQLAALGEAGMLFTIGVPFEEALLKKIKPIYPKLRIVETDSAIEKRSMPHEHAGHQCTNDHGAKDPHVWLSPQNAERIATCMFNALAKNNDDRHAKLVQTLKQLDEDLETRLAPFNGSRFYVFHPSFGYFADRYGLTQVPIELDGKSPAPRQLADLIEQAQVDGVKVVFVQKQFPAESAQAVADAIGGNVVQLDPLAEDVVANLRQIAEAVAQTLEQ